MWAAWVRAMVRCIMSDPATKRYALLFFGLALGLSVGLGFLTPSLGFVAAWVLCSTAVAFGAYGLDKLAAIRKWLRVPERVLLALSFAGGTLGALAGMKAFRHKTAKTSFRFKFWLVTAAQVVALGVYYRFIR